VSTRQLKTLLEAKLGKVRVQSQRGIGTGRITIYFDCPYTPTALAHAQNIIAEWNKPTNYQINLRWGCGPP